MKFVNSFGSLYEPASDTIMFHKKLVLESSDRCAFVVAPVVLVNRSLGVLVFGTYGTCSRKHSGSMCP